MAQIISGHVHTFVRFDDGSLLSWGYTGFMQGALPTVARDPNQPSRLLTRFTDISAGYYHNLCVLSDGTMQGWGTNSAGQCDVPPLPAGLRYEKGGAGGLHSVALRSDGALIAWGDPTWGRTAVPPLPPGLVYTDVATSFTHNVALRSDGMAVSFGDNTARQGNIPPLPPGMRYVDVAVSEGHTVLARSDGACFDMGLQAYPPPPLPSGVRYRKVAKAEFYSAAICSDGSVVQWGSAWQPSPGFVLFPPLPSGVCYVEIAAGGGHTVARRSDGEVVVSRTRDNWLQEFVPPLEPGTSYVQVAAGTFTVVARVGPTSTYTSFASGCAGSRPASRLVPYDTPRIGDVLQVALLDLPTNAALMVFGFARLPSPMSLAAVGMPGCALDVQIDAVGAVAGSSNEALYQLPIPNAAGLVGLRFANQALVLDPLAGNALGAVVSAAAEGVIGHW